MDGDHGMVLAFTFEEGNHRHGATTGEDDAGQELALAVGDVALELDEADARTEHIHGLEVNRGHREAARVDRSQPVGERLGGQSRLDVDTGLGGHRDAVDRMRGCVGHRVYLQGLVSWKTKGGISRATEIAVRCLGTGYSER